MIDFGYVVVLLTAHPCEEYDGKSCVMAAVGPYDTRKEARRAAATYPDWAAPHVVLLSKETE